MPPTTSRICIAIGDQVLRRRVIDALKGLAHRLMDVTGIDPGAAARRIGDEHLILVVGSNVGGPALTPIAFAELRALEPFVPIFVCVTPRDPLLHRLADLAIAGVDHVVVLDGPDTDADLRLHAKDALGHILPSELNLGVRPVLGDRGSAVVLFCARNGYRPITERAISEVFGCNRSQVLKSVKRFGWPDVQHVIGLARLTWVALELDRSSTTSVSSIARSLRFTSAEALHKRIRRLTGYSSRKLKFTGATRVVLERWRQRAC